MFTREGAVLPDADKDAIVQAVGTFTAFVKGNDPYGDHDFGAFTAAGHECFWQIYYYDQKLEFGSEDPADTRVTRRVLTIMLKGDY